MSEAKAFPSLPDPWADGPTEEVLMFPLVWSEHGKREHGRITFSPASRDEIGELGRVKMTVPGGRPVYWTQGQMRTLIDYFQKALAE